MQRGISLATPPPPKRRFQCLPPMLRNIYTIPIRSCSKAPRGLSVFPQLAGIFTGIAFSPGSSPRQYFTRYAIRARPKLPDEVFRYLRTVIVTADIHRGLYSPAPRKRDTFRI